MSRNTFRMISKSNKRFVSNTRHNWQLTNVDTTLIGNVCKAYNHLDASDPSRLVGQTTHRGSAHPASWGSPACRCHRQYGAGSPSTHLRGYRPPQPGPYASRRTHAACARPQLQTASGIPSRERKRWAANTQKHTHNIVEVGFGWTQKKYTRRRRQIVIYCCKRNHWLFFTAKQSIRRASACAFVLSQYLSMFDGVNRVFSQNFCTPSWCRLFSGNAEKKNRPRCVCC